MVSVFGKFIENVGKDSAFVPAREASIHGLPGAETLGQIAPLQTCLGDVENRVQE